MDLPDFGSRAGYRGARCGGGGDRLEQSQEPPRRSHHGCFGNREHGEEISSAGSRGAGDCDKFQYCPSRRTLAWGSGHFAISMSGVRPSPLRLLSFSTSNCQSDGSHFHHIEVIHAGVTGLEIVPPREESVLPGTAKAPVVTLFGLHRGCAFLRKVGDGRARHRTLIVSNYCSGARRYVLNRDQELKPVSPELPSVPATISESSWVRPGSEFSACATCFRQPGTSCPKIVADCDGSLIASGIYLLSHPPLTGQLNKDQVKLSNKTYFRLETG